MLDNIYFTTYQLEQILKFLTKDENICRQEICIMYNDIIDDIKKELDKRAELKNNK